MNAKQPVVLVVEDESHISDLLCINLKMEGYEVVVCSTGVEALSTVDQRRVDLMILDVMLPDGSGIDVCRQVKHIRKDVPILMLSALGQSSDKIKGLRSGADDYLAKPFNLEELLIRIEKLMGRFKATGSKIENAPLKIGRSTFYLDRFEVYDGTKNLPLTAKEAALLKYMYERKNEVLSRQEILENVWAYDVYPNTRTIDNMISSFRKYVGDDSGRPHYFRTVRGVGYRLSL